LRSLWGRRAWTRHKRQVPNRLNLFKLTKSSGCTDCNFVAGYKCRKISPKQDQAVTLHLHLATVGQNVGTKNRLSHKACVINQKSLL